MIKDSGKKLFDMVIVWKLDRFARNRYDSARYKSLLKKNGVKVVSATEVISEGAEGIILESVLEGYAEYYSADLAEKVVRGMTDNALKCKFNGGTIPIGYVIDDEQHFQADPITAPYVLEVFKRYDKGTTMTELRDWLNEQGVKNTRGNPITYNSIQHMLCNRRYIGEFAFRDTVIPNGIPSIVPDDLFERVQKKLEVNKKAPARHKAEDDYLLTTKIFCGYCGAYLCGESGTGRNGVYHYYKCVSVKKKRTECECKPVRKAWIENLVLDSIMEMLADDRTIDAITSMVLAMQDQESVALPMYEQQLQEANTGINNLLNAIQQGILTKSTKSRLEELEAARDELENKIALEKLAKPRISEEFVRFFLERFRNLDLSKLEHRKMLIEVFLNAVYVFNDKIVISCNYKDGTKTVNFSEMESALTLRASASGSDLDCAEGPFRILCFLLFRSLLSFDHPEHAGIDIIRQRQGVRQQGFALGAAGGGEVFVFDRADVDEHVQPRALDAGLQTQRSRAEIARRAIVEAAGQQRLGQRQRITAQAHHLHRRLGAALQRALDGGRAGGLFLRRLLRQAEGGADAKESLGVAVHHVQQPRPQRLLLFLRLGGEGREVRVFFLRARQAADHRGQRRAQRAGQRRARAAARGGRFGGQQLRKGGDGHFGKFHICISFGG